MELAMAAEIDGAQWDSDEREVLRENTAQAIHEQLETQDNLKSKYERRWLWELFQNALDAAGDTANLKIRIQSGDSFIFSHNGLPFSRKQILHLIFHGSTKRESVDTIGRYGTGFLTTHVVSRKVRVRGQLDTGQHFEFLLDRSGDTPSELMQQMEKSRLALLESRLYPTKSVTEWTEFEYMIDDSSRETVKHALSDLGRIAIPVIAFNRKIHSIDVSGRLERRYELLAEQEIGPQCVLLQVGDPARKTEAQHLIIVKDEDLAIAVPLGVTGSEYSVLTPGDTPRLFVAFPLFGTESIPFPFLLNSTRAIPTEERNGLFLGEEERETNTENKSIVEKGWQLYKSILNLSVSRHWGDMHRLAVIGPPQQAEWLDQQWLKSLLRTKAEQFLAGCNIVHTSSDEFAAPLEVVFPMGVPEELFNDVHSLTNQIYRQPVVHSDCAWEWSQNLENWHELDVNLDIIEVSLKGLLGRVGQMPDVAALRAALNNPTDSFDWLNRFLALLIQCKENWNSVSFLPNQMGKFTSLLKLQRDDGIDPGLKEIADLLGESVRGQLLDTRIISSVQSMISPLDQEKLIGSLLALVRSRKAGVPSAAQITGNVHLLGWLAKNRRAADLKTYPFLVRETDTHGTELLSSSSVQLLAPPEVWPDAARNFVDLFPADHVISSSYVELLSMEDWLYLESQGICWLNPVFRKTRSPDPDEVSSIVQDVRSVETGEHALSPIQLSDVAFINTKDKGILDTARSSKLKGVLLLRFLFSHVIPSTSDDLEYREVGCSCGQSHYIHSAAWLIEIKGKKWVYESKGHPAYVSAVSLARLMKDDLSLMEHLAEDSIFAFFARLGVSPSELRRAALNLPDNEMAQLERAILGVLNASNNDPRQLEQIAELVSSAPELLAEFEERKKVKERVRLNQALGKLVEDLFRELFTSTEIKTLGLLLKRTGIGSDFSLENDFIEDGQEKLFGITGESKDLLIEIKSTLGSSASMTHTQANLAADRSDSFVLCVVPLENREPTADIVKMQSRFVPSIGGRLQEKVEQVSAIKTLQELTVQPSSGVQVVVEQGEFRYRVSDQVWNESLSFEDFKIFLIRFFEKNEIIAAG
jgi:hypothetical protein